MISGYPYILIHHCTNRFSLKKHCVMLCHIVPYCVILCHCVSAHKIRSLLPNICGRSILFNKYMFASSHIHNMDYDCGYNGIYRYLDMYISIYNLYIYIYSIISRTIFHEYHVMRSPIQLQYNPQLTSTNCLLISYDFMSYSIKSLCPNVSWKKSKEC